MADGNVQQVQDRFDAEHAKGYRGARVDPNPNSDYSYESDPMTSPGPGDQLPFDRRVEIDQFADPSNPRIADMHGPDGLTDADELPEDFVIGPQAVAAQGTGGTSRTTEVAQRPLIDGVVTSAKITATANIAASADPNNRTFVLHNKTKNKDVASFKTSTALVAGTETTMPLNGTAANLAVSDDDEFTVVETANGTGQAHGGVSVKFTVHRENTPG